jgi:type VI secretion system protein ImpM
MPREAVNRALPTKDAGPVLGWYGKLPATGDFVSRRVPSTFIARWDAWLQRGMTALRDAVPGSWQSTYDSAAVWNALLPAGIVSPNVSVAIMAPSHDRVGRRFPFCVVVSLPPRGTALDRFISLPDFCARASEAASACVRHAVALDEIDRRFTLLIADSVREDAGDSSDTAAGAGETSPASDIADVLGEAAVDLDAATLPMNAAALFPWPDLARTFEPAGATSYWWVPLYGDHAVRGFTHEGPLDARLFLTLFSANNARERPASSNP